MEGIVLLIAMTVAAALAAVVTFYVSKLVLERRFEAERRRIREEAARGSRRVLGGKFAEQLAPFLPGFHYDPTEARFLGSPIDLIVFPGLSRDEPQEVVLVEVKSGNARLTERERKVRDLVQGGKVRWELLQIDLDPG